MRERTTWNREKIAQNVRIAEDPRAMNQDHLSQQPAADKYEIGGPSDFAEDVHPSNTTWKAEYSGGEVKRNEIGMPELRGDTFNHAEKTAAEQQEEAAAEDEVLEKKASLCIKLAKRCLSKKASESMIEDQALAFMHMPDAALIESVNRLAAEEEDEEEQSKQAQQQQAQQQAKDDAEEQKKQAAYQAFKAACDAMAQTGLQQDQVMSLFQQALGQGQQQQAPAQVQQQLGDDQLLDQMLQDEVGQPVLANSFNDIELDGISMDVGETHIAASEDEVLKTLFASNQEVIEAQQANAILTGIPVQASTVHTTRTASKRTIGTQPSVGVSAIGSGGNAATGGDIDKLSSLWQSAPDVKGIFGI